MPLYEFRCKTCDETFEKRRPMAQAGEATSCPSGHADAVRLLSVFASVGGSAPAGVPAAPAASSGGGCGSSCGCAH